jgi:hypothetical protein
MLYLRVNHYLAYWLVGLHLPLRQEPQRMAPSAR